MFILNTVRVFSLPPVLLQHRVCLHLSLMNAGLRRTLESACFSEIHKQAYQGTWSLLLEPGNKSSIHSSHSFKSSRPFEAIFPSCNKCTAIPIHYGKEQMFPFHTVVLCKGIILIHTQTTVYCCWIKYNSVLPRFQIGLFLKV